MSIALVLPATGGLLTVPRPRLRFPAIITRRGDLPDPGPPEPGLVEINRQPLRFAADWQLAIAEECRRQQTLGPAVFHYLQASNLLTRCLYLSSETADGPLLFRYIGVPTRTCLGDDWARANLGKPDTAPSDGLVNGVDAQYREAIDAGQPVYNRVFVTDVMDTPLSYTHMLVGWRLPDGRRAVLSALELL
ncbi:hypothetical protein J2847_006474 [Azospirillum agricola]|uniref:hypothetical protein n=1 Tax=Azospirillum agricola TaxID=1720247 RepID=UPI001AE59281|nr:hypothetical protein [Azospirillum agricola]MBP2233139.1 hypothetical protein [Azospirillum agricola]